MTELDEMEEFFDVINELKHSEREGWKKRDVDRPRDTIASHSFGAALIAWVLAEGRDLDSEKMIKMLLVHDLIMAYIEDYTPEDEKYSSKKYFERQKKEELLENLPDPIRHEASELIEEIREQETETAVNAKEIDKLDTILQARKYSDKVPVKEFLEHDREYFKTEEGKKIFQQLESDSS
jgi:putative hydrolase of HD superfamily